MKKLKFSAQSASLTRPDGDGDCFAPEALKQMAEQAKGKDITYTFDFPVVGKVISAKVKDSTLIIEGKISVASRDKNLFKSHTFLNGPYYAVPSYQVLESYESQGCQVHSKVELIEIGITDKPADPNITPMIVVDND